MSEYNDCYYCGGMVREENISREIWWDGNLYVFENVPAGVCVQCGERIIKPKTAKHIDHLLERKAEPQKVITVPVFEYA